MDLRALWVVPDGVVGDASARTVFAPDGPTSGCAPTDRARGNLDRHGVHFLTAYVAGV